MLDPEEFIALAEVTRPHGVRGELRLKLYNESSDVLLRRRDVTLRLSGGGERVFVVEGARRAEQAILLRLAGIDDRDKADGVRGAHVCVRRRELPELDQGEFYAVDAIGCEVYVQSASDSLELLGRVTDLITYPTVEALLVESADGTSEWEVPLTDDYVRLVDVAARRVELLTLEELAPTPRKKKSASPKE